MRKFFYYSLICAVWLSTNSCRDKDKAASAPGKPSFTVDKTTGLTSTVFTFTVPEVSGDAISVLPYGVENLGMGGVLISKFAAGKATVTFSYAKVGTFNAVVVANNHSADGTSVKNTYSDPVAITIHSDQASISDFTFDGSTKTTIDETVVPHTIDVIVPWRTSFKHIDVTKLVANFTASDFSAVLIGTTAQKSGTTVNSFSSPVTYTVKADNGITTDYKVTVTQTPAELNMDIKSFTATATSTNIKNKVLGSAIDNAARNVVLFDTLGSALTNFDSVTVKYELDGKFATLAYKGAALAQGKPAIDFSNNAAPVQMIVHSEDSVNTTATYKIYAATIPKLTVSFSALNPTVSGSNTNFAVSLDVLNGTDHTAIATTVAFQLPAGVATGLMTTDGNAFVSGGMIDYSNDVKLAVQLIDANLGFTYWAVYTLSVTVVK